MAEQKDKDASVADIHTPDKSQEILRRKDEEFQVHTWENLKSIISANKLEELIRLPSQLRAYLEFQAGIKEQYGNVTNFLLKQRLCWESITSTSDADAAPTFAYKSPVPFADRSDYRILINDAPYALADGIVHICVWSKVRLPVDDVGDLTVEARSMVQNFVERTFVKGLDVEGQDKILWFKNWATLQSVRGIDHVHVLVKDVNSTQLERVIERPQCKDV